MDASSLESERAGLPLQYCLQYPSSHPRFACGDPGIQIVLEILDRLPPEPGEGRAFAGVVVARHVLHGLDLDVEAAALEVVGGFLAGQPLVLG